MAEPSRSKKWYAPLLLYNRQRKFIFLIPLAKRFLFTAGTKPLEE